MIIKLLRYKVARLLLKTTRRNAIREVEMGRCVNPLGFSFGKDGWHFIVEYLREVESNPSIHFKDSILYQYHKFYQPISMSELVRSAGMEVSFDPGFFRYPWGNFRKDFNYELPAKDKRLSRFCGPSDDDLIQSEATNITKLRDAIKVVGYNPWKSPNSFIGGSFLKRRNGEYRFVVLQGNHRVSVMSYLGIKTFIARDLPGHYSHISEGNIDEWYYVRNGMCSREDAKKYFDAFFILNGIERAQRLQLIQSEIICKSL